MSQKSDFIVIGGGMTAVDAAVQAKLLGAEDVTMVYRGDRQKMSASLYEQELATSKGVRIVYGAKPIGFEGAGSVAAVDFAYSDTGETFALAADQVLVAIGQTLEGKPTDLATEGAKIAVSEFGATSVPGVWAGGDCASGGDDLTVTAVAEGRDAAMDIQNVTNRENIFARRYNRQTNRVNNAYQLGFFPDFMYRIQF